MLKLDRYPYFLLSGSLLRYDHIFLIFPIAKIEAQYLITSEIVPHSIFNTNWWYFGASFSQIFDFKTKPYWPVFNKFNDNSKV